MLGIVVNKDENRFSWVNRYVTFCILEVYNQDSGYVYLIIGI